MAVNYNGKFNKYLYSTGVHYISNSGSDERGQYYGGKDGDQTGLEWCLKAWYQRGWNYVLRYDSDSRVGPLLAELACAAALNNKIGYDQYNRTSFWYQLKSVGYDPEKITVACEDDCSAGVCALAKAVGYLLGIPGLKGIDINGTTYYMASMFKAAGFTVLTAKKYTSGHEYLLPGDILLLDSAHTATNVTAGSLSGQYGTPPSSTTPEEPPIPEGTPTLPTDGEVSTSITYEERVPTGSRFNVEFFDKDLNAIHHDTINELDTLDDDYLAASTTEMTIARTTKLSKGNFLWIGGTSKFLGIISDLNNEGEEDTTVVTIKPFIQFFDQEVLINVNDQGSKALETVIANAIKKNWISSDDTLQNIPPLSISTTSSTTAWDLGLKTDTTDQHYTITPLYSTLIVKALSKYGIAIDVSVDMQLKKINLSVGTRSDSIYIDADLPNVKVTNCKIHDFGDTTNKLVIWNTSGYSSSVSYYLHPDGSYDTKNSDRILPVRVDESTATPSDDKTFSSAAKEVADNAFSGVEWTDLIELEVYTGDSLIRPYNLKYGQSINVVYDGKIYKSIFTGRKFENDIVTLMFGTVREELTKQLRLK